jgi:hypothetical protein
MFALVLAVLAVSLVEDIRPEAFLLSEESADYCRHHGVANGPLSEGCAQAVAAQIRLRLPTSAPTPISDSEAQAINKCKDQPKFPFVATEVAFGEQEGAMRSLATARDKITIIIPSRGRANDVLQNLGRMLGSNMAYQNLVPDIYIAEQLESYESTAGNAGERKLDLWNKGQLFNAAVREIGDRAANTLVLHDADVWELYPGALDYRSCLDGRTHHLFGYAKGGIGLIMGGIICTSPQTYRLVDGFASTFEDWGYEDVDFGKRLEKFNVTVVETSLVGREDKCIHDVFSGGGTQGHGNKQRVGSLQPGLRDAKYLAMPEKNLHRKGDSGTVTLLRFDLPSYTSYSRPKPCLPPSCVRLPPEEQQAIDTAAHEADVRAHALRDAK